MGGATNVRCLFLSLQKTADLHPRKLAACDNSRHIADFVEPSGLYKINPYYKCRILSGITSIVYKILSIVYHSQYQS